LAKDCLALQKNPRTNENDYHHSPLLVLNNFKQDGKEFKVMTAMLQNMFPPLDVQTVSKRGNKNDKRSTHLNPL
jgi:ribosome biogenesis protein SSF1/2